MFTSPATADSAGQRSFRKQLEQVITEKPVRLHAELLGQLATSHPQALLERVSTKPSAKCHAYNCFMHVLHLVDRVEPNVMRLPNGDIRFLVDSVFFRQLYETGILTETTESELQPLDLIVYYCDGEKRHVGQYMAPNVVESKWGVGPLLRHGTWDLPLSYGDQLRYFKPPSQEDVDAFVRQQLPLVHLAP
jgi:hypothetical protein